MDGDTAFARLKALLVADFDIPAERVRPEAHLRVDLGLDSLTLTDLALLVQADFGFKVGPEAFRGVNTAEGLAELIARHAP